MTCWLVSKGASYPVFFYLGISNLLTKLVLDVRFAVSSVVLYHAYSVVKHSYLAWCGKSSSAEGRPGGGLYKYLSMPNEPSSESNDMYVTC